MRIASKRHVPWYLWPFWSIWQVVAFIVGLTGRLLAVVLGFVFMLVGVILTVTVVGAIIGIPMIILGFLILLKGIF